MPRRLYSPDEKADAFETLNRFGGDIAATSFKTGIPQRTLYTWRTEQWDQQRQQRQSQPPSPLTELPQFEDSTEALEDLRTTMFRIVNRIPSDLSHLPPYLQHDHHLARIGAIDIILKLTEVLGIPEDDEIQYIYEDDVQESQPEAQITHIHIPLESWVS